MPTFRLVISRNEQLLGYFQSDVPHAQAAIASLASDLGSTGYDLELQIAHHERRLLESGPEGLRVISSEPLFVAVSLDAHLQT
ncbi:cytoplasmic protein [Pseudomonas mendocina]|nr:cytoplasmic protein [Pseudomonas mendocina]MBH3340951.1 cytoplasmic protein [Pseudomonas mendocina]